MCFHAGALFARRVRGIPYMEKAFTWRSALILSELRNFGNYSKSKVTVDVLWVCYIHPFLVSTLSRGADLGDWYTYRRGLLKLFVWSDWACEGLDKMNGQRVQIPALFLYMPRKSCLKVPDFGSLRWFKEEAVMKAFIRWVWVLCLFPPRVFGQAKLPVTTSDHFVVEAPAVVQPGGETVDFIVGVEGSRFYTAYNMEIALPEDLVFVPNDKGNCAMMCDLEGMYPYDDSMGFPQFTHIFASGLQVNGNLRVACFSSLNEDFTSFSGRLFRVSVKASPYAKPGMGEIRMFGLNLTVAENAQKYIPEGDLNTGEIEVGNHASVPVSISAANRYGTCILPFGLEALPAGLEAYNGCIRQRRGFESRPRDGFTGLYALCAVCGERFQRCVGGYGGRFALSRRHALGHGERADGDCHAAGSHRGIYPAKPRGWRAVLPCGGRAFCLACRTVLPFGFRVGWSEPQDGA